MLIDEMHLVNFKRFSNLKIDLKGTKPKLVLLIGTNGSGKSAIFDAFEIISLNKNSNNQKSNWSGLKQTKYYIKNKNEDATIRIKFNNQINSETILKLPSHGTSTTNGNLNQFSFYGRSAIRYLPRLTRTNIGTQINIENNVDKPDYFIDRDNRFENDIDILIKNIIDKIFAGINTSSAEQIDEIKVFLNRINEALPRIFGNENSTTLKFIRPITPSEGNPSQLIFLKGNSEINYDLLSSGEKEVINILFNLFIRTPFYQDTIYFFDELDSHLNTSLQYSLLKEIVEKWIPENCQIWTASHSLGFIQYANEQDFAAIIDFDSYDFDQNIVLHPTKNPEIFDIAVPKESLNLLFKDKKKVFCENQNAFLLNNLVISDTVFLGDTNKNTIALRVEADKNIFGLIDRDLLSSDEMIELKNKLNNLYILNYYCFENYLYHPDNLLEVYNDFDVVEYKNAICLEKNKRLDDIIRKIDNDRNSYIFFKPEKNYLKNNIDGFKKVKELIESNDFETFYQVFSMKNRGNICKIHNIDKIKLVKTNWFRSKIEEILK